MDSDHTDIPHFALLRHGTVILRLRMDVTSCCQPYQHPVKGCSEVGHRLSSCEQCTRTRLNRKFSDCDSDIVDKCRPYRTRTAKSRYVNVCAAVCLLLLVGGLTPQSSAAPPRGEMASEEENPLWGNPCDYNESAKQSKLNQYMILARRVAVQARNVLKSTLAYKDDIVKLHQYENFETLLDEWTATDWLLTRPWHRDDDDILPRQKEFGKKVEDDFLTGLMNNINQKLPAMGLSLKLLVAGLMEIGSDDNLWQSNTADNTLQTGFKNTMEHVRAVLCLFSDVMSARGLEMPKLLNSQIPEFKQTEKLKNVFLVYRDTVNYLEYIEQVFEKLSETPI